MKLQFYGLTDVGRKRDKNEDSLLVDEELGIFMVADGMGGHLGGEYASQMAVKTVEEVLRRFHQDPAMVRELSAKGHLTPGEELKYAIGLASRRIFKEASRVQNLRGMGTTSVAIRMDAEKGYIANVGDSRAYLIRPPLILQLTIDHSLVTEQLAAGFITESEVKNHKLKNIITRSVGFQDEVEVDLVVRDLEEGDNFIICSDGLTNMVSNKEIVRVVSKNKSRGPKVICESLVQMANQKGGDDNVTVIFIAVIP
ncbi:MAG: Stp1/IreP family PP2C-type Ser/Thr phosphatase [Deltaproteobacteria bacterium]|nr:Stp1/IreP family PP2C-type Ser/Thr phosphatase [Deltaproteobacteria bacterium]MBI4374774.1 Stp1/IreP family PP2C-type Ser/Thr phosphatase [Deltaproteobacteria bacterium]